MKYKAVFFDCWSTIISFFEKNRVWSAKPLIDHCTNLDEVDSEKVLNTMQSVVDDYYESHNFKFEISVGALFNMIVRLYGIKLDCPIRTLEKECLDNLDPKPITGVERFLKYLDDNGIYFAILSNTIYNSDDTINIINRLIPNNKIRFFYGSKDVGVKKPYSLFFLSGIAPTGFKPEECIYIGDSFYQDVYGSFKAGFGKSIYLNTRNIPVEQFSNLFEEGDINYLEVKDYNDLLDNHINEL